MRKSNEQSNVPENFRALATEILLRDRAIFQYIAYVVSTASRGEDGLKTRTRKYRWNDVVRASGGERGLNCRCKRYDTLSKATGETPIAKARNSILGAMIDAKEERPTIPRPTMRQQSKSGRAVLSVATMTGTYQILRTGPSTRFDGRIGATPTANSGRLSVAVGRCRVAARAAAGLQLLLKARPLLPRLARVPVGKSAQALQVARLVRSLGLEGGKLIGPLACALRSG